MEIGRENNNINNKTFEQVKNEFFHDLKSYEEILGSRNERDRLQRELKNLEIQTIKKKDVMHIQKLCKASKDYQMQEFMKMILLRWTNQ